MDKPMSTSPLNELLEGMSRLELERIVSLSEAARLSGVSEDSLRRHFADKIIQLGPRRRGMRLKHALFMNDEAS
jgi:hypothetical protein